MNLLPGPAQLYQAIHQCGCDVFDLPPRESIVLTELYRSGRTVQIDYCFATSTNHVNVGGTMIVWINRNPQSFKPENRRHCTNPSKFPKRLGLEVVVLTNESPPRSETSFERMF